MYIYVIGPPIGPQKIGISNDVNVRLKNLQTGNPERLVIHHIEEVTSKQVRLLEKAIHRDLNHKKLKGEWFDMTQDEAKDYVVFFNIRYGEDPLLGV